MGKDLADFQEIKNQEEWIIEALKEEVILAIEQQEKRKKTSAGFNKKSRSCSRFFLMKK